MIPEAVLGAFGLVVKAIVTALPLDPITFPSFGPLVGLAKQLDAVLPVHEAVLSIAGLFALAAVVQGFQLWLALYKLLPFKGT